jgi:cyclic pyranopterin monophosphate synthase
MNTKDIPKEAEATGFIHLKPHVIEMIKENREEKGNITILAEKAGIQAVKSAGTLIPHIQSSESTVVQVRARIYPNGIEIKSQVTSPEPASIESEALMAVITALVTVFELSRTMDHSMVISDIKLLRSI